MKKLLSLLLILSVKTAFCQTDMLAYRPLEKTVGETYIMFTKHELIDYYNGLYKTDDPQKEHVKFTDYKNLKLKLLKIDKINGEEVGFFVDSAGNKFNSDVTKSNQFYTMVPALDLENAKKIYLEKPVWTNEGVVPSPGENRAISKTTVDRFVKYKVIDVSVFENGKAPIKLTLQAANGSILKIVASLTQTNSAYPFKPVLLSNLLFTQDPKTLYNFTPQTWANIAIYNLVPGMSKDAVRLIEGDPDEINNSGTTSKFALDQWVYPHNYIYFEGGKFKSKKYRN